MAGGVGAQLDLLGVALARHHEERARTRDDEEPVRHRDAGGGGARDRPEHEAGRDRTQVEHRLVLQPDGVGDGDHDVAGDDEREPSAVQRRRDSERQDDQHRRHDLGEADADVPRGDGPRPLVGVEPVGLGVERVVQEVGAAGREAERDERDECGREVVGLD